MLFAAHFIQSKNETQGGSSGSQAGEENAVSGGSQALEESAVLQQSSLGAHGETAAP